MAGTALKPRLFVYRSAVHIYAQLINDDKAVVVLSASDKDIKAKKDEKMTHKVKTAFEVGKLIAQKSLEKKIETVVFDRGGIVFHGRVKAVADGAREGGLKF